MGDYWTGLVWLVVLLVVNAFFVGAEFAVISARRSQIEPRAEAGSRAARTTLWAMEHATLMLATSQLGITVCSLLILNVAEPSIHHLLEIPLQATPLSPEVITVLGFVVALMLVTFLHVVFGEMIPKNLAFSVPARAALLLAPPLVFVGRVLRPVIWLLNAIANAVLRVFRVEPKDEATSAFTLEEVAGIVEQSTREGVLPDPDGRLAATFEFTTKKVSDVAIPMARVCGVDRGATPDDLQHQVATSGHSRYPVLDDAGVPVGYLHLKDVLDLTGDAAAEPIPVKRIRPLATTEEGSDLEDALAAMRTRGAHIARSVDAHGQVSGILFLEDIIEVLVGEITDTASS